MVMQITLRFVPLLAQTAERIAKAQASRGAEWGGKTRGLIQPNQTNFAPGCSAFRHQPQAC